MPPKTRIVHGEHFADILVKYSTDEPPVYYWICQKFDVAEILGLGMAASFEAAEQEARDCLTRLHEALPCDIDDLEPPRFRVN